MYVCKRISVFYILLYVALLYTLEQCALHGSHEAHAGLRYFRFAPHE